MANMEENDREELFEKTNKMERSRIINLADKHCSQIMDLIHRSVVSLASLFPCLTSTLGASVTII